MGWNILTGMRSSSSSKKKEPSKAVKSYYSNISAPSSKDKTSSSSSSNSSFNYIKTGKINIPTSSKVKSSRTSSRSSSSSNSKTTSVFDHDLEQGESFRFQNTTEAKEFHSWQYYNQYVKQGVNPMGFTGTMSGGILHVNDYEDSSGYSKRAILTEREKGIFSDAPTVNWTGYDDIKIMGGDGIQRIDFSYLTGSRDYSTTSYGGEVGTYGQAQPKEEISKYGGGELEKNPFYSGKDWLEDLVNNNEKLGTNPIPLFILGGAVGGMLLLKVLKK